MGSRTSPAQQPAIKRPCSQQLASRCSRISSPQRDENLPISVAFTSQVEEEMPGAHQSLAAKLAAHRSWRQITTDQERYQQNESKSSPELIASDMTQPL